MLTAILIAYPGNFIRIESTELAKAAGYRVLQTITQKFLLRSKFGIGSLISKIITRLDLITDLDLPPSIRVKE